MAELPEHLKCFENYFQDDTFESPLLSDIPPVWPEALTEPVEETLMLEQPLPPSRFNAFWQDCIEVAKEAREMLRHRRLKPYAIQLGLGGVAVVTGVAVALFSPHETSDTPRALSQGQQPAISHSPTKDNSNPNRPVQNPASSPTYIPLRNLAWPRPTANLSQPDWAQSPSPLVMQPQPQETVSASPPYVPPETSATPPENPAPSTSSVTLPPTSETTEPVAPTPSNTPSASASASASESSSQSVSPSESLLSTSAVPETPPTSEPPTLGG